jgi:chromosome segregation ATPase
MIKKFLRLFEEHRRLERDMESEKRLVASLGRYIDALEGRDKERLSRIEELEAQHQDALITLSESLEAVADLRKRLEELRPNHKEEL